MRRRHALLALCSLLPAAAATLPFRVAHDGEVVAHLTLSSPDADWSAAGREAALATLTVDGGSAQHLMLWAGPKRRVYSVFLGRLAAGAHKLAIERHTKFSSPGAGFAVHGSQFEETAAPAVAHAPVLYARANTVGGFTDVPLLVYCEKLEEKGQPLLEYTVIFSNEDGGTSTRALMARWGRTTDIEYVYRAWLDPQGGVARATIQVKDHKEAEFRGQRIGTHPVLIPSTQNNMVSDEGESAIRYQLAPVIADLRSASREQVMDSHPETYRVAALELVREGKLRPFGSVDGQKISDPRNYVTFESRITNRQSSLGTLIKLKHEDFWRSSHLGRPDYAISRSGWVRTTVELPPGTRPDAVEFIGFECLVDTGQKPEPVSGECRVEQVTKAFFLDPDYRPEAAFWHLDRPVDIPAGQIKVQRLSAVTSSPGRAPAR